MKMIFKLYKVKIVLKYKMDDVNENYYNGCKCICGIALIITIIIIWYNEFLRESKL